MCDKRQKGGGGGGVLVSHSVLLSFLEPYVVVSNSPGPTLNCMVLQLLDSNKKDLNNGLELSDAVVKFCCVGSILFPLPSPPPPPPLKAELPPLNMLTC